ncbi:MAG: hypothetical protein AAF462_01095 [Thermodesulfobacteriota bacterium]
MINEHEEIRFGKGYPSLIRFFKGDPAKPLVVFFPGWSYLGRISYGFPGCDEKQFLAYWITRKGYSFLATSYPIDHPVYQKVYPSFTLTNWGEMVAQITDEIISEHGLNNKVINIHWSAAGQVIRPFNVACKERGVDIKYSLGIETTPALNIPSDRQKGLRKTRKKLVSIKYPLYDLFWQEITEQCSINDYDIMTKNQHNKYFLGDIPVGITGTSQFYINEKFVEDPVKAQQDKGFFSFAQYPLVAVISGNSTLAPYHPIVDKYTWGFLMVRKIYHDTIVNAQRSGVALGKSKLKCLLNFVDNIPNRLSTNIAGNHFLFVGKKGAKAVSNALEKFELETDKIMSDISGILR